MWFALLISAGRHWAEPIFLASLTVLMTLLRQYFCRNSHAHNATGESKCIEKYYLSFHWSNSASHFCYYSWDMHNISSQVIDKYIKKLSSIQYKSTWTTLNHLPALKPSIDTLQSEVRLCIKLLQFHYGLLGIDAASKMDTTLDPGKSKAKKTREGVVSAFKRSINVLSIAED